MRKNLYYLLCVLTLTVLTGCGKPDSEEGVDGENPLTKVVLQTDWYAQPEHGGFYQAMVKGYYEAEGLDVEILPGGPNAFASQKLAQGSVQFVLGRSDDLLIAQERGIPLMALGALMQKDPQGLMFHKEAAIKGFEDLDGRTVMTVPGAPFLLLLEKLYDIEVSVINLDYGMSRFLADKNFIQQCFITNEPYYVAKEGANPDVLLLSDSGFKPYRIWYSKASYAKNNPEVVKAFTRASIKGWKDYMTGDRSEANAVIASRNPKMTEEFMEYVYNALKRYQLVEGYSGDMDKVGKMSMARFQETIDQLRSIGMLTIDLKAEDVVMDMGFNIETETKEDEVNEEKKVTFDPAPSLKIIDQRGSDEPKLIEISREELLKLPQYKGKFPLEVSSVGVEVKFVLLEDIWKLVGDYSDEEIILANCQDGYQSNYDLKSIDKNKPAFFMEIEGMTVNEWVHYKEKPIWGPQMIMIQNHHDLMDPAHKNPWGVDEIIITNKDKIIGQYLSEIGEDSHLMAGFDLFMQNCTSCHKSSKSVLGGDLSNRTFEVLAAQAKYNSDYFNKMLKDPASVNPAAAKKMAPLSHYSEEQIKQLMAFVASMAP